VPIIPVTWEAEIGRILVQGQPGKNNKQARDYKLMPVISATWEVQGGEAQSLPEK
jgi:hypothetical protein